MLNYPCKYTKALFYLTMQDIEIVINHHELYQLFLQTMNF